MLISINLSVSQFPTQHEIRNSIEKPLFKNLNKNRNVLLSLQGYHCECHFIIGGSLEMTCIGPLKRRLY